jgi:hypothetical protein
MGVTVNLSPAFIDFTGVLVKYPAGAPELTRSKAAAPVGRAGTIIFKIGTAVGSDAGIDAGSPDVGVGFFSGGDTGAEPTAA